MIYTMVRRVNNICIENKYLPINNIKQQLLKGYVYDLPRVRPFQSEDLFNLEHIKTERIFGFEHKWRMIISSKKQSTMNIETTIHQSIVLIYLPFVNRSVKHIQPSFRWIYQIRVIIKHNFVGTYPSIYLITC